MATVTGKTSEKIDELINALVSTGSLDSAGALTLTKKDGTVINLGSVGSSIVGAVINTSRRLILTTRQGATLDAGFVGNVALDAYPVGAIYMSAVPTSPTTLFGGTWVNWGQGRVPVGVDPAQPEFDAVEETGGQKSVVQTPNQMPGHTHSIGTVTVQATLAAGGGSAADNGGGSVVQGAPAGRFTKSLPLSGTTGSQGNNEPMTNLQPYITCYMWKRVA